MKNILIFQTAPDEILERLFYELHGQGCQLYCYVQSGYIEKCNKAGIKTVMITGDHKITAIAIAKELGILESEEEALTGLELENMSDEELTKNIRRYSVYARVSPEHKVRIVKAWKANGEIVAMTGDRSK